MVTKSSLVNNGLRLKIDLARKSFSNAVKSERNLTARLSNDCNLKYAANA